MGLLLQHQEEAYMAHVLSRQSLTAKRFAIFFNKTKRPEKRKHTFLMDSSHPKIPYCTSNVATFPFMLGMI